MLSERREGENEASRRLKTEFLVQFDGVSSRKTCDYCLVGEEGRRRGSIDNKNSSETEHVEYIHEQPIDISKCSVL